MMDRVSDELYAAQVQGGNPGTGSPVSPADGVSPSLAERPLQGPGGAPMRKRNSEILNTLIGLPAKLRARG